MNVGIIISHTLDQMEEKFSQAATQGFHHCQITSWEPSLWTEENAAEIRGLCEKYEMEITAFWCGWAGPRAWNFTEGPETLGIVPVAFRAGRVQNLLDGAAYARLLGVTDVVTHMGFIPENMTDPNYPGVKAAVAEIARNLKKNGQNLLFETGQETPVVLLRLFEDIGTGNLYVNLDPANLVMCAGDDPVQAVYTLRDYIVHTHAKDGIQIKKVDTRALYAPQYYGLTPCSWDAIREVPLGKGGVDWNKYLDALREIGYDGYLTIERECGDEPAKDIGDAVRFLDSFGVRK